MRNTLKKLTCAIAACAAFGMASAAPVVDFDNGLDFTFAPSAPLLGHRDTLIQNEFWIDTLSTKAGAAVGDLVGFVADGSDVENTCFSVLCPTNNGSQFLGMLNSAIPAIGRLDGGLMNLRSFDAAFISDGLTPVPDVSMVLRVVGFLGGATVSEYFDLPGLVGGELGFNTFSLSSDFMQTGFEMVAFYGYACDAAGSCSRAANTAQFGLDNVTFVPEPASLALVMVGLVGVAGLRRRSQA